MIETIFWICVFVFYFFAAFYWIYSFYKGAPFYPSSKKAISDIISGLNLDKDSHVIELGSGDGRVAIAIAKKCGHVTAVEINPYLTLLNRLKSIFARTTNLTIVNRDMLKMDFSQYNRAVIYLYPGLMERLEKRLFNEMPKGALIVSNTFRFKNRTPIKKIDDRILVYQV